MYAQVAPPLGKEGREGIVGNGARPRRPCEQWSEGREGLAHNLLDVGLCKNSREQIQQIPLPSPSPLDPAHLASSDYFCLRRATPHQFDPASGPLYIYWISASLRALLFLLAVVMFTSRLPLFLHLRYNFCISLREGRPPWPPPRKSP